MKLNEGIIEVSAGDLSNHIGCSHLTYLDLGAAKGSIPAPDFSNSMLEALQKRGWEFENEYLKSLKDEGLKIATPDVSKENTGTAYERTVANMYAGVDIIYQATLKNGIWQGRADFLIKVDTPSKLGAWSYEVIDSKLAKETRSGTILQLCLYSQLVGDIQGSMPTYMHVITPEDEFKMHSYRLDNYLAYYRLISKRLENTVLKDDGSIPTYPNLVAQCDICKWWKTCDSERRKDDHLSLVAGMGSSQVIEIEKWGINTLESLAQLKLPIPHKPSRGAIKTYERLREQSRVQLEGRVQNQNVYECLPLEEGKGFYKLPAPSEGDIFFDFEGDPFAGQTGMEYLFGYVLNNGSFDYCGVWALTPEDEKRAFEDFVDVVMDRWEKYPDLHIYHFTAYEPSALKRLMGKYATRENEIDRMLRAQLFIDLHSLTKQALLAGVEVYSLKELEKFHGFERAFELREAALQLRIVEGFIESKSIHTIPEETLKAVEVYNKEDCLSTKSLRDWLEELRSQLENEGNQIPRPANGEGDASEALTEYQMKIQVVYDRLMESIPTDPQERTDEQHANWLLAQLLAWYRREEKASWWEYFRLRDLPNEELIEEKAAISGLHFTGIRNPIKRSVGDLYTFPMQESELRVGDKLKTNDGGNFGEVIAIDSDKCTIEIKKGPSIMDIHPLAIFKHEMVSARVKEDAIFRIATWVSENGIDAEGNYRAGRDLLLNRSPRTTSNLDFQDISDQQKKAVEWVQVLDNGVLPIQGPPGAGKSHTAASMILKLIGQGKKIGITAMGHKVIVGLMQKVVGQANEQGMNIQCLRKVSAISEVQDEGIAETTSYEPIFAAIKDDKINIIGGTAWLWSREEMFESVDFLIVDEAGQLSLIDTLAVSQAAKNMVLLGDPQQLQQPVQGSHPEGTEISALEHVLRDFKTGEIGQTISADQGIFLNQTWRLHPSICSFVSELFYDTKLTSKDSLVNQSLSGNTSFLGSGLWLKAIAHNGNRNSSNEEADLISTIITDLVKGDVFYTDWENKTKKVELKDILVIAPYNAQVALLKESLPAGAQIGTVDKFQGQEAPVVLFSMATSSPADAPRGMEFLYSQNRLNVAVSRARASFILVGNPTLFEPECKNVRQMKLANAFCRYLEMVN